MREFVIYRCHDDGYEVFRFEVKRIQSHTESEAQQWVENEERCNPFRDVWFEVDENMEFKQ